MASSADTNKAMIDALLAKADNAEDRAALQQRINSGEFGNTSSFGWGVSGKIKNIGQELDALNTKRKAVVQNSTQGATNIGNYNQALGASQGMTADLGTSLANRASAQANNMVFGDSQNAGLAEQLNMRGQTPGSGLFADALAKKTLDLGANAEVERQNARLALGREIGGTTTSQMYDTTKTANQQAFDAKQAAAAQAAEDKRAKKDRNAAVVGGVAGGVGQLAGALAAGA